MRNKLNFIHCADLHCGITSYSKNTDTRILDWQNAFNYMIKYIEQENIPYIFLVGDLFHKNIPDIDSLVIANKCLFELSKKVKHIFLVAGNHDINSISKKRHILQSINLNNLTVLDDTKIYSNNNWSFDILHYHYLNTEKKIETTNFNNKPLIVTFHGNVTGAIDDLGNPTGESQISLDRLLEYNPIYVALGHIHKRQFIKNDKQIPIIYPGSFIQTSFSEKNVNKGFLNISLEIDGTQLIEKELRFIKTPYIEYASINQEEDIIIIENVKDKIIRIDCPLSLKDREKHKDILKKSSFCVFNNLKKMENISTQQGIENKYSMSLEDIDIQNLIEKFLSKEEQELLGEIFRDEK